MSMFDRLRYGWERSELVLTLSLMKFTATTFQLFSHYFSMNQKGIKLAKWNPSSAQKNSGTVNYWAQMAASRNLLLHKMKQNNSTIANVMKTWPWWKMKCSKCDAVRNVRIVLLFFSTFNFGWEEEQQNNRFFF